MPEPAASAAPRQTLSTWDGIAFIVGIVIGIGIFKTPSLVASNVGSETAFLGAWLLGGVVMLLGLHMLGLLPWSLLMRQARFEASRPVSLLGAFVGSGRPFGGSLRQRQGADIDLAVAR